MIREVTFPLETQSENHYRGANKWGGINMTAKQRKRTREVLDEAFVQCAMFLDGWQGNRFVVTMTRISPRFLDDDNIRGALKAIRDETALWIGFKNDDHDWLTFKCLMQQCKADYQGVRIEIACNEVGKDQRHLVGASPILIGEPVERAPRNKKPPMPNKPLPCFAAPPWAKVGVDEFDLIELKLDPTPPERIKMKDPKTQATVTLRRTPSQDEDGPFWLYVMG